MINLQKLIDKHIQCGKVLSENPEFLIYCFREFSRSLIERNKLSERIEFLYQKQKSKDDHVCLEMKDRVMIIKDIHKQFGGINLILLKNYNNQDNCYSIRAFSTDQLISNYLKNNWQGKDKPTLTRVLGKTVSETSEIYEHYIDNEDIFWTFSVENSEVILEKYCSGFDDPIETRRVVLLIRHATNVLGFPDNA